MSEEKSCVIYRPVTYDTEELGRMINAYPMILLNMDELKLETRQMMLDFASGLVFATNRSLRRLSQEIFLISEEGIEISFDDEL